MIPRSLIVKLLIDNIFIERPGLSQIKYVVIGVTASITLHRPKGRVASYVSIYLHLLHTYSVVICTRTIYLGWVLTFYEKAIMRDLAANMFPDIGYAK